MVLLRKLRTLLSIVQECSDWPTVIAAKLGFNDTQEVRLRNGLIFALGDSVRNEWGEFFEAAVVDCYGISRAQADIIVDVGANIGAFSCLAGKTHPHVQIYAFEPNPVSSKLAKMNFERNGIENVHLTQSPVTADGREVVLHINENRGSVSVVLMGEGEKVPMRSVTLGQIPFGQAGSVFFKIDCEGVEGELIRWIVEHIDQLPRKVTLICEYHPWYPQPLEETIGILRGAGFETETLIQYGELYLKASRVASNGG